MYKWYVAQAILQIDTQIAEKGYLWIETRSGPKAWHIHVRIAG